MRMPNFEKGIGNLPKKIIWREMRPMNEHNGAILHFMFINQSVLGLRQSPKNGACDVFELLIEFKTMLTAMNSQSMAG